MAGRRPAPARLLTLLAATLVGGQLGPGSERSLVVLLLDGCRWDYLDYVPPDQLGGFRLHSHIHILPRSRVRRRFLEEGVRAAHLETVFPSFSLPAWTSISTGLYPESHGILGNQMYDPHLGLYFRLGDPSSRLPVWWQQAEPVWTTATRQGVRTATLQWSTSDVAFRGVLPEVAEGFGSGPQQSLDERLERAACLLSAGFRLVLVHWDEVDSASHRDGPASFLVRREMEHVGASLERFFQQLRDAGLWETANVILLSDHGHTPSCRVPPPPLLPSLSDPALTERAVAGTGSAAVHARSGRAAELAQRLEAELNPASGWELRRRADIPERFHYRGSARAPDLLLFASRPLPLPPPEGCPPPAGGVHGPDPDAFPDMRAIFLAWGGAFRGGGRVVPPLRIVDVYQVICHVLGLQPRPNNGSWAAVSDFLQPGPLGSGPEMEPEQALDQPTGNPRYWLPGEHRSADQPSGSAHRRLAASRSFLMTVGAALGCVLRGYLC